MGQVHREIQRVGLSLHFQLGQCFGKRQGQVVQQRKENDKSPYEKNSGLDYICPDNSRNATQCRVNQGDDRNYEYRMNHIYAGYELQHQRCGVKDCR